MGIGSGVSIGSEIGVSIGSGIGVGDANASFHHGGRIEAAGCKVMYLPPYSPDLNRIDKCWAWIKSRVRQSRVRKLLRDSYNLRETIDTVLKQAAS